MRIHCHDCGKMVSNELPEDTVVRATSQCPECTEKLMCDEEQALELAGRHESERSEAYEDISCPLAVVDFVKWLYEEKISIVKSHK